MKVIFFMAMGAALTVPCAAMAQSNGCDAKRQSIETEIAYAQAHGNTSRVQGLQKALSEMRQHCTDETLRHAAAMKVDKAQGKLAEKQLDLDEAKRQGKSASKIADRQRKVDAAHAELEQAIIDAK